MAVYNHRDFWERGAGAKGLSRDILKLGDEIEFDNGKRIPAYAKSTYAMREVHGPFRQLTDKQEYMKGDRKLVGVDKNGIATVVRPILHYADRFSYIAPDGREREDVFGPMPWSTQAQERAERLYKELI